MDIKANNFVKSRKMRPNDPLIPLKLIDFGSSVLTEDGNFLLKSVRNIGTTFYMAPEIEKYEAECTGILVKKLFIEFY